MSKVQKHTSILQCTVHPLNCHSLRHMGQCGWGVCEFTHFKMQWRWKAWLHAPQTAKQQDDTFKSLVIKESIILPVFFFVQGHHETTLKYMPLVKNRMSSFYYYYYYFTQILSTTYSNIKCGTKLQMWEKRKTTKVETGIGALYQRLLKEQHTKKQHQRTNKRNSPVVPTVP